MQRLSPFAAGFAVGGVFAAWHAVWSALVALGWAQRVLDFLFWIHFIKPVYVVQPFNPALAAMLVVVTALVGFLAGAIFAWLWNRTGAA